jgi:hypothetical protein
MEHARIFAECVTRNDAGPFFVDAFLAEDGKIVGKWLLLGLSGDIDDKNTWYPFVVRADGVVDFGCEYEEERWSRTNIRERAISEGATVSVWDENEDEYVITKIVRLGQSVVADQFERRFGRSGVRSARGGARPTCDGGPS